MRLRDHPLDHPVGPVGDELGRLASGAGVGEHRPARHLLTDPRGGQPLVVAVVPLGERGVVLGVGKPDQRGRLHGPAQRAREHEVERDAGQRVRQPADLGLAVCGQRQVRVARVAAVAAPLGRAVAAEPDVGSGHGHSVPHRGPGCAPGVTSRSLCGHHVPMLLVGTADGLLDLTLDGTEERRTLDGANVSAISGDWAIADGWVMALDTGAAVELPDGLVPRCLLALDGGRALVGTSDARLLVVGGPEGTARDVAFDAIPTREGWSTPWGGPPDTRSIALADETPFVGVHVGRRVAPGRRRLGRGRARRGRRPPGRLCRRCRSRWPRGSASARATTAASRGGGATTACTGATAARSPSPTTGCWRARPPDRPRPRPRSTADRWRTPRRRSPAAETTRSPTPSPTTSTRAS